MQLARDRAQQELGGLGALARGGALGPGIDPSAAVAPELDLQRVEPSVELDDGVARLRAAGSPHVWPRFWTIAAPQLAPELVQTAWQGWLDTLPDGGPRRCGVAQVRAVDRQLLVVVVVEPLADLEPLPTRARLGRWLQLRARVSVFARGAAVILLGPLGPPRAVPTRFSGGEASAVFSLDQVGLWRAQLVLDTERGPRPALEAWTFVEEVPSLAAAALPAPGERERPPTTDLEVLRRRLLEMVNAARRIEQLAPLRRDPRLDRLAQEHAVAVRLAGQAGHDAGHGAPPERLSRADLAAARVGENVAQARDLARAHRALWNSPSHRGNLVDPRFDSVGLGIVVEDASRDSPLPQARRGAPEPPVAPGLGRDGPRAWRGGIQAERLAVESPRRVWVCEIFAESLREPSRRALRGTVPKR